MAVCLTDGMSWEDLPHPDGVEDLQDTPAGFTAKVSIPCDEDGYLARECPSCSAVFKMLGSEYNTLPADLELTCPYCGHREYHGEFITAAQTKRAIAAAQVLAEQWAHREINRMLSDTFGRSSHSIGQRGSVLSMRIESTPGSPPALRDLPELTHEKTRRVIQCSTCSNHVAVYSSTAFCPVCGPRPAAAKVLEALDAAEGALRLEDKLAGDEREALRALGVFERAAVDALESVVGLFESFTREQFTRRVTEAAQLTNGRGNVFQRLDDTAALFSDHASIDLINVAGAERWTRLKVTFAIRHLLTHQQGIVDERFLATGPDNDLSVGQRIVVNRSEAALALDDLREFVNALNSV